MNEILATIDLNPAGNQPSASVIWLHGLGADGNDFVPIVDQFKLKNVRFVFPQAPIRSVTVNNGMKMPAWYDIESLNFKANEDTVGIQDSEQKIQQLIEREKSLGIASNRIVLAGFSQGGAIALYTGLRLSEPLAGIIALSTYLPSAKTFLDTRTEMNGSTPIFMAHGLFDPVVPLVLGQMSYEQLKMLGYALDWHTYPMPHTVILEEIKDIERFLQRIM